MSSKDGRGSLSEDVEVELRRLEARIEAKYCLFDVSGLTTVEVIRDFEQNLGELKKLTEEVVVRVHEVERDKVVGLWREKLMMYMSKMRLKEKELGMENKEIKTEERHVKSENAETTTTEPNILNPSSPGSPAHLPAPQLPMVSTSSPPVQEAKKTMKTKARKRKSSKGNLLQEQIAELQASPRLAPYEQVKLDNLLEQARLRDQALGALGALGGEGTVKTMEVEELVETKEQEKSERTMGQEVVMVKKLKFDESAEKSMEVNITTSDILPHPKRKRKRKKTKKYCDDALNNTFEEETAKFEEDKTHDGDEGTEKLKASKKKGKTKSLDAASHGVLVADSEGRAGRCCLCDYTTQITGHAGDRRRAVLLHQAKVHFGLQVTTAVPASSSSCPSCSFTLPDRPLPPSAFSKTRQLLQPPALDQRPPHPPHLGPGQVQ